MVFSQVTVVVDAVVELFASPSGAPSRLTPFDNTFNQSHAFQLHVGLLEHLARRDDDLAGVVPGARP